MQSATPAFLHLWSQAYMSGVKHTYFFQRCMGAPFILINKHLTTFHHGSFKFLLFQQDGLCEDTKTMQVEMFFFAS